MIRQLTGEEIRIGQMIEMEVGENNKTGQLCFMPQFIDDDKTVGRKSVRIFLPTGNGFRLQDYEVWIGKVLAFNANGKLTKDNRTRIFINVEVLGRDESERQESYDEKTRERVISIFSGNVFIREIRQPAIRAEVPYLDGDKIVFVEEIKVGNEVVRRHIKWGRLSKSEYLEDTKRRLGSLLSKSANLSNFLKDIKPLPAECQREG